MRSSLWRWRRPSALLLALLLALDAALGAVAAAPHAEHVSRTLAAAALAVRAAANASSQCSGTTSPWCKVAGGPGCSTSSDLSAAGCNAWVDFFDSTGGAGWTECSQYRLDPCACSTDVAISVDSAQVVCRNSHIIGMYARGSHAQLPRARSRRPLSPPRARPPTAAAANPRPPPSAVVRRDVPHPASRPPSRPPCARRRRARGRRGSGDAPRPRFRAAPPRPPASLRSPPPPASPPAARRPLPSASALPPRCAPRTLQRAGRQQPEGQHPDDPRGPDGGDGLAAVRQPGAGRQPAARAQLEAVHPVLLPLRHPVRVPAAGRLGPVR